MKEIFHLINSMAPYLLLGFMLAGIMHAFIPNRLYCRYLGGKSFRSVFNAALLGIPLPLCSCGVIPTAMSLRKEGASKGATLSFLIATPQTGVDSIIATYSLMGLPFALIRPFAAFVTALLGGTLMNKLDEGQEELNKVSTRTTAKMVQTFSQKVRSAIYYAFVEMMQDIGKWLLIGLIVAGLITVFVPDSFFAIFSDKPLLSMLLVLIFAIPMYLCATGSIPIAVALMLKGLSPGTALVLLMAGPAVNFASILVISKVMGKKALILYLISIILGAITFGLGIDYLLPREWFTTQLEQMHSCHGEVFSYFNFCCFILLMVILTNAFVRKYLAKDRLCSNNCTCSTHSDSQENVKLYLKIKGMHCNHCKNNAEKAILSVSGVRDVHIDLNSEVTIIYGNPNKNNITSSLKSLGFDVVWESNINDKVNCKCGE
ncbi:MAG: heavy metal-associated domain-containing protein [Bacteroidales bacterium]|nr:heavy metal-associated domain-containing protein [Bacteroidales bacterium]